MNMTIDLCVRQGEVIAEQLLAQGPEQGLSILARLAPKHESLISSHFFQHWIETDPDAALEAIQTEPNVTNRDRQISRAITAIAKSDVARAQVLANRVSGRARYDAWSGITQIWIQQDMASELAWFDDLQDNRLRDTVGKHFCRGAI